MLRTDFFAESGFSPGWPFPGEILWALRRLEARGLIRSGRFVTGVTGEQFANEETVPSLRPRRAP